VQGPTSREDTGGSGGIKKGENLLFYYIGKALINGEEVSHRPLHIKKICELRGQETAKRGTKREERREIQDCLFIWKRQAHERFSCRFRHKVCPRTRKKHRT